MVEVHVESIKQYNNIIILAYVESINYVGFAYVQTIKRSGKQCAFATLIDLHVQKCIPPGSASSALIGLAVGAMVG